VGWVAGGGLRDRRRAPRGRADTRTARGGTVRLLGLGPDGSSGDPGVAEGGQERREAVVADPMSGGTEVGGQGVAGERTAVGPQLVPDGACGLEQVIDTSCRTRESAARTIGVWEVSGLGRGQGNWETVRVRGQTRWDSRRCTAMTIRFGAVRDEHGSGDGAVLQDAGQQLDRDQQGDGGPSSDDPADGAVVGGGDVSGQARGGAGGQGGPWQPPGFAPGAAAASMSRDATISTPSTESGNAWACQPVSPCAAASWRM